MEFGGQVNFIMGFPSGSAEKESASNARDTRDTGLISGLGRSPGGGDSNKLQYPCLENPWTKKPGGLQAWGCKESDMTEAT